MNRLERNRWRSKNELVSDVLFWTPPQGHTSIDRLTRTFIYQLWAGTESSTEDQLSQREREREREREKERIPCNQQDLILFG